MALETYRQKRDFTATSEPRGRRGRKGGNSFVIQKHNARRLHYDFRLEMDGVLKSWAVTLGPSLVAGRKRLAVHVEDHPLDYGDFEGTIPKGAYGAGTVIVWDRGTWTPIGDAAKGYAEGHLEFELSGEKLRGRWYLIRMQAKPGDRQEHWLLIKARDAFARDANAPDILRESPDSVKSGRTLAEVAAAAGSRKARKPVPAADPPAMPELSHPGRVYWPAEGITKEELADYYAGVWPRIAPFITGRPLALLRCPEGIEGPKFFQKHVWKGMNAHVVPVTDPKDPAEPLIGIADLDGLIGLVQGATLEIHPWGAATGDLERPDMIVMDLDPGEGVPWQQVVDAAREVRRRLVDAGLAAFVKTSGGKGLHVVSPLKPDAGWPEAKAFGKDLAEAMAQDAPELYVATIAKAKRRGKILIDYLRNQRGQTAVAPYSSRARPGATVSTPLDWGELAPEIGPGHFTIRTLPKRLATLAADPWEGFRATAVPLPPKAG